MKNTGLLALLLLVPAILSFPAGAAAAEFEPGITLINTAELKADLDAGMKMVLINTLSPIEYRDMAIRGSVNLPYEYLRDRKVGLAAEKDTMLVFYCLSAKSAKSPKAARLAVERGYRNVYLYAEGISEWAKAGYPTESAEPLPRDKFELLNPAQMKQAAADEEGTLVVDVRDDDLYEAMKFPFKKVLHIEMAYLRDKISTIPKEKKILVVCHTGQQSIHAARYLKSRGYDVAGYLDGGIMAWQKAGEAVVQ